MIYLNTIELKIIHFIKHKKSVTFQELKTKFNSYIYLKETIDLFVHHGLVAADETKSNSMVLGTRYYLTENGLNKFMKEGNALLPTVTNFLNLIIILLSLAILFATLLLLI